MNIQHSSINWGKNNPHRTKKKKIIIFVHSSIGDILNNRKQIQLNTTFGQCQ